MVLGSAVPLALALLAAVPRPRPYADHLLVEVEVADAAALRRLLATGVDPWLDHPRPGVVPVLVSPEQRAMLWADGWTLRVLSADVQADVDAEHDRLAGAPAPIPGGGDFFADFRDLEAIDAELDATIAANPELVTAYEIGASIQGRTIRALRITAAGDDARPAVLVTSGQHSREWIAVSSGMYVVDQLITRAAEPEIAAVLDAIQIIVIPMVNPDGYAHSWTAERYWRKNRRDGVGVDTNRNFGHSWGGEGSSPIPEDENYAGAAAFSEPESAAVRDFVLAHPELVAHLDLHSYGQLVLYPWGDIYELAPDDAALANTADAMVSAMGEIGASYTPLQGVNLYPASGNIIDWAYGDVGLHSLTIELRPDNPDVGFVLGPDQIAPVGDEVFAALSVLFAYANGEVVDPTDGGESSSGGAVDSSGGALEGSSGPAGASSGGDGAGDVTDPSMPGSSGVASEASAEGTAGGSSSGGAQVDGDQTGCGCRAPGVGPGATWVWIGFAGANVRRRRPRSGTGTGRGTGTERGVRRNALRSSAPR
ncbi:MAG: hypothetical protein JNK45_11335 [Myxococcales bacterium]|nr:hypothetical protein [Myxococcales bacterium]